jgi:hypothetical protein
MKFKVSTLSCFQKRINTNKSKNISRIKKKKKKTLAGNIAIIMLIIQICIYIK